MKILYSIMLCCFAGSTVSLGPPSSISTLTEDENKLQGGFPSSTEPSPVASTLFTTTQQASTKLKETTVVIIVSVSLALLVCAVIPFIFFGSCRSKPEAQSGLEVKKDETAVRLQSLDPECSPQDASQNTTVNQS